MFQTMQSGDAATFSGFINNAWVRDINTRKSIAKIWSLILEV